MAVTTSNRLNHGVRVFHLFGAVPDDFDYNPHSGKRGDRTHRVELKRSSVEYIAPSEYMVSLDCERVYDLRMTMSD